VRGYGLRTLKAQYRREMGSQMLVAVVAFGSLDFDVDRGELLTELFGSRLNQALIDLRTDRLLWWMILAIRPLRPFYNAYLALARRWGLLPPPRPETA
jgi:hypothetical protein